MNRKVLIIGNSAKSLLLFRRHLMLDLVDSGYTVVAGVPMGDGFEDALYSLSKVGIRLVSIEFNRTSLNFFRELRVIWKFFRLLKKEQPQVLLNYTIKPVIYGSILAKLTGIQNIYSIITGLGYVYIGDSFKVKMLRVLLHPFYRAALKFNKKIFFQNPDDLSLFVDKKIVLHKKSILINGSGVDIDYYSSNYFPSHLVFLLAARLIKDKGIYEYIAACRILKERYPRVIFRLAGDLDANPASLKFEELQQIIDDEIIEYLGFVEDIRSELIKTSVFVLPSYREGTPRSVLEAMAMSRPIVTTDVPGCRETVINVVNGYLVAAKNVDALVKAMEQFILHPEIIVEMGRKSRIIAEERFDVNKVNRVILKAMGISQRSKTIRKSKLNEGVVSLVVE